MHTKPVFRCTKRLAHGLKPLPTRFADPHSRTKRTAKTDGTRLARPDGPDDLMNAASVDRTARPTAIKSPGHTAWAFYNSTGEAE